MQHVLSFMLFLREDVPNFVVLFAHLHCEDEWVPGENKLSSNLWSMWTIHTFQQYWNSFTKQFILHIQFILHSHSQAAQNVKMSSQNSKSKTILFKMESGRIWVFLPSLSLWLEQLISLGTTSTGHHRTSWGLKQIRWKQQVHKTTSLPLKGKTGLWTLWFQVTSLQIFTSHFINACHLELDMGGGGGGGGGGISRSEFQVSGYF